MSPETCAECGFDSDRWRVRDVASLFSALGSWWSLATTGVDDGVLNERPGRGVWSAAEYGGHMAVVTSFIRYGIEQLQANPDVELPAVDTPKARPDDAPAYLDQPALTADLEREGAAMATVLGAPADPVWESYAFHAAHDASHHFMDIGRGLAALDAGTPAHTGTVVQVNASAGGVPKLPTDGGRIDHNGLVGDVQSNKKHHGRPFQALCLWSADVIDELASQGHPIGPGCAGENLTLAGIDWEALRPGARLRIGTALAEISFVAVPCAHQTQWFSDGDFNRIAHERNPQWVRWYAWVREPGEVRPGDAVTVQP